MDVKSLCRDFTLHCSHYINTQNMKNIYILILSLVGFVPVAFAQDDDNDVRNNVAFGLKVGANYSNVYDSQGEDFSADGKFGLAAGGFLHIPIGKLVGIQPEVLFSQKGFKGHGSISGSGYDLTRTTNYLDVPLFLAIKPAPAFTLLAGPQFSYLLSQHDVFSHPNLGWTFVQDQQFNNDDARKNMLCLVGGFDINIDHAVLSGRVGWDVQNNRADGSSSTPRYKNVWVQATVGFRLY